MKDLLHRLKMRLVNWCFDQILDDGEPVEFASEPRLHVTLSGTGIQYIPGTTTTCGAVSSGTYYFSYPPTKENR